METPEKLIQIEAYSLMLEKIDQELADNYNNQNLLHEQEIQLLIKRKVVKELLQEMVKVDENGKS